VPLNGDIAQRDRERTVSRLKDGQIDIVVATDVAARGLDVDRISHVINYDVPHDTESYVHRIGRTGRAGRKGEAILFIAPRERNMLRAIERATRQVIEPMNLPTVDAVNDLRIAKFKQRISETLDKPDNGIFRPVLEQMLAETGLPLIDIAVALAGMSQGATPLLLAPKPADSHKSAPYAQPLNREIPRYEAPRHETPRHEAQRVSEGARESRPPRSVADLPHGKAAPHARARPSAAHMETFRIEVGGTHGAGPGNIVGAIANESGIEGVRIGRVDIREDHSYVDLPEGMPRDIFAKLQKVRIAGRELRISRAAEKAPKPPRGQLSRFSKRSEEPSMSKGMERKKEQKKKPSKTLEEKRAAKKEKKSARG
jgi:ATP-dependent RNA helicase DeaD